MKVSENDKILLKAKSLSEMRQKSIALYVFQKYLTSIMDSCALLRLTKSYNDGKKKLSVEQWQYSDPPPIPNSITTFGGAYKCVIYCPLVCHTIYVCAKGLVSTVKCLCNI